MAEVALSTLPGRELSDGFQQRVARGRAARTEVPRAAHAEWVAPADRADPIALLEEQAANRVPELVPIRYGRMMVSPFTFYRGAALIMAADLSSTLVSGITVQLCGDAHLSNFGMFGSPERTLVFDINDFDETLPGPWEWDVKRLVASFEIAGRNRAFGPDERRAINLEVVKGYRERMRISADSPVLASWYSHLSADDAVRWVRDAQGPAPDKQQVKRTEAMMAKARTKDSMSAFTKLVRVVDGELRILADPPLIVPIEDVDPAGQTREEEEQRMRDLIADYQTTLIAQHHPISELEYLHMARKVVGVGSVGTRAWIILMRGRDDGDPVLLQAKEAQESVLARFVGASAYENQGERVVRGQRMMQSASDIFLGWQQVDGFDGRKRDFYIRQLHDWKGSVDVELIKASGLKIYARMCGETLARAHARSGDRVAIAAYLGKKDRFDQAIAEFAVAYADQNDKDYAAFIEAVASGRLEAQPGL